MKTVYFQLMLMIAVIHTVGQSQIPNNGFENWQTVGNCQEPTSWYTTNLFDTTATYFAVTKASDHYPASIGNFSIRLQNDPARIPAFNAYGIALSTRLDGSDRPLFPLSGHPTKLCGYYKFTSVNNDTMSINVYLLNNDVDVASGHLQSNLSSSGWTSFSIPISTYVTADSARISIMACNFEGAGVQGNSVLYVDNLSFDSLVSAGVTNEAFVDQISIYPNPACGILHIGCNHQWVYEDLTFRLLDITGRDVNCNRISETDRDILVDVSHLPQGIYLLHGYADRAGSATWKIVIAR